MTSDLIIRPEGKLVPAPVPGAVPAERPRGALIRALRFDWLRGPRLNALGKLFHTTAFKLTLVYLTVFALFAALLLAFVTEQNASFRRLQAAGSTLFPTRYVTSRTGARERARAAVRKPCCDIYFFNTFIYRNFMIRSR